MTDDLRIARDAVRARAEAWTAEQASRLAVTPDDVLRAICRGWLPEEIAALPHARAGDLAGKPPYRDPKAWNP